jgi:hypothetical protein
VQKQYEKYLLSLWNRRRQGAYPPANHHHGTASPLAISYITKYDGLTLNQSTYYDTIPQGSEFSFNNSRFTPLRALPPYTNHHPTTALNYHNNQSYFRELPSTLAENSIKSSNYQTTGAIEPPFSYPSALQVRYDDMTQMPPWQKYQQTVEKKPFYHNDSAINNDDTTNLPTTINSIYSQQQHYSSQPISSFGENSAAKKFYPIYQPNNQPLENRNYNSENLKMSETFYGKPLIIPAVEAATAVAASASTDSHVTQLSPQPLIRGTLSSSSEMLLKNHSEKIHTNVHMSDGDEESESDGEKCNSSKRRIRRSDSISDDTFRQQKPFNGTKAEVETSLLKKHDEFIDNLHLNLGESNLVIQEPPREKTDTFADNNRNEIGETRSINDSVANENMHQIWEKVVEADPIVHDSQLSSNFVIPKIIVETQIDLADTLTGTMQRTMNENLDQNTSAIGSPEKLLNHDLKKHSIDNHVNGTLSSQPPQPSTVNNNLPLEEARSSIYHYDKQPLFDEQQNRQQSSVEHELRNFNEMKISQSSPRGNETTEATHIMTYESEIKTNNSLAEGISDDEKGGEASKKTINNINDDENQSTTTVALNDKINEIYRKIEKVEGDYYEEKGKIIENFERRMSSSSLNEAAKIETQAMIDSADTKHDSAEVEAPRSETMENIRRETDESQLDYQRNDENMIYNPNHDPSPTVEWKDDQHQSEIVLNSNQSESQEMLQPNYNYENYEPQQNYTEQTYPETLQPSDDYSQPYQNEGQQQQTYDDIQQYDNGGNVQMNLSNVPYDESQYPYEQTPQQYQEYSVVGGPHQQQSEFVYSHHDNNTQQIQNQQQQEANNYNLSYAPQLDSNYQQNNFDETQENPSNYTNDSAALYYDYDQNQQQ